MSRPPVSVVMPFAGDESEARAALGALGALRTIAGDELILADNSGLAPSSSTVTVIRGLAERSPAHARNAGAAHAHNDWILFLDADCRAPANLLDAYFEQPVEPRVGALAGEVLAAFGGDTLAARYGAARSFLSQRTHLAHPYLPRAVAANLLVRRAAFEQLGGFYEGLRAAEDTDFSWRLQQAGWRLELRAQASVEHRYRATVRELRAQWRGYAAGRAWLRRRYDEFTPQPATSRALRRASRIVLRRSTQPSGPGAMAGRPAGPESDRRHLLLDAMLGVEELAGLMLSNRPARDRSPRDADVVLVADRFPAQGDPLVDYARTLGGARVEAAARPQVPWLEVAHELDICYREDDGLAERALAVLWLLARHPVRSARDLLGRGGDAPALSALAPAALRLERSPDARVHPLGGSETRETARRLAELIGRGIEDR